MADAALASQPRSVVEPSRFERSPVRSVNPSLRTESIGQTFGARFSGGVSQTQASDTNSIPASFPEVRIREGLLATGASLLLAETRTAEATAPFTPLSNVDTALTSYENVQAQIRESLVGKGTGRSDFVQDSGSRTVPVGSNSLK